MLERASRLLAADGEVGGGRPRARMSPEEKRREEKRREEKRREERHTPHPPGFDTGDNLSYSTKN